MHVDLQPFDLGELSRRIEQERERRGLTMAAVARQVGVAASTIRRFQTADDAEADGVLSLIAWVGDAPERFISKTQVVGTVLPPALTGCIRVDMDLVAQATSRRPGTTTRTTIQRLASAAQLSGRTIASLTRWSQV